MLFCWVLQSTHTHSYIHCVGKCKISALRVRK
jgi:hypothetical protein